MDKLLSIIIPTYNMEKYLRKCLDSLIVSDENMQRLEVLIINDGSKDSSSQIAHEYEAKYPETFRVIDKENGNYGSCINRGLKEASGKYVKVLDADDYFDNEIFEKFLLFLEGTDVDMILSDYVEVDEADKIVNNHLIPYPDRVSMNVSERCGDSAFWMLQMHAVTYRLAKLLKNDYVQTTGVSYTDQEWMFLPVTYMDSFCHFQGILYQYLVGREGQSIDKAVSSKQTDVSFNLIYKRIGYFEKIRSKGEVGERKMKYLYNRLLHSSYSMYKACLIGDEFPEDLIVKFDDGIKVNSSYIYNEIAISTLCKFKGVGFIGYWREHRNLPLKVRLLKILFICKRKINGL